MNIKQHRNGDISFWFSDDLCVAIKFAGYDTVDYFIRYEQGRWVERPMTSGAFKHWYYGKGSNIWGVKAYCKLDDFDTQRLKEFIKYVKGGVL